MKRQRPWEHTPAGLLIRHLFLLFLKPGVTSTKRQVALLAKKRPRGKTRLKDVAGSIVNRESGQSERYKGKDPVVTGVGGSGDPSPQALLLEAHS